MKKSEYLKRKKQLLVSYILASSIIFTGGAVAVQSVNSNAINDSEIYNYDNLEDYSKRMIEIASITFLSSASVTAGSLHIFKKLNNKYDESEELSLKLNNGKLN